MALHFKDWPRVVLVGLGQLAFSDSVLGGVLVLAGIAAFSPTAAVGALVGATIATAAAYTLHSWNGAEKAIGLPVPNLAILGMIWSLPLSQGVWNWGLVILSVAFCLAAEQALKRLLVARMLPLLVVPVILTAYPTDIALQTMGGSLWRVDDMSGVTGYGMFPTMVFIFFAAALKSLKGALHTCILIAVTAIVSAQFWDDLVVGPVALWAFTVTPAFFGVQSVFLADSRLGTIGGLLAAAIGAAVWAAWTVSPLGEAGAPFLVPYVLGTWAALASVCWYVGPYVADPVIGYVAGEIRAKASQGRGAVLLTGAGCSTASGIPDYVSGTWLDPDVPVTAYSWRRFCESPRCRRIYWEACNTFRQIVAKAVANDAHAAAAALERHGWIAALVTQNVDRLHQQAGSRGVIELHGRIDRVRCISCGRTSEWPEVNLWERYDLRCSVCDGYLKPAVIAFGEDIPSTAWRDALEAVERCGVLIVIGTQLAVSSAADLVARARARGALVVHINRGAIAAEVPVGDVLISANAEDVLPALTHLLDSTDATGVEPPAGALSEPSRFPNN